MYLYPRCAYSGSPVTRTFRVIDCVLARVCSVHSMPGAERADGRDGSGTDRLYLACTSDMDSVLAI